MSTSRAVNRTTVVVGGEQRGTPTRRGAVLRAARASAALLGVVAAFHAAVALGAPWGELTQGGGTTGTLTASGRLVAAASSALSILMAAAVLGRAGLGPWGRRSSRVTTVLAWFTVAYAAIGAVLNLITRSTGERALWAPVSLLLLALVTFVMVTSRRQRGAPAT